MIHNEYAIHSRLFSLIILLIAVIDTRKIFIIYYHLVLLFIIYYLDIYYKIYYEIINKMFYIFSHKI